MSSSHSRLWPWALSPDLLLFCAGIFQGLKCDERPTMRKRRGREGVEREKRKEIKKK